MRDEKKTKAQLIAELNELRTENMALGALRAEAASAENGERRLAHSEDSPKRRRAEEALRRLSAEQQLILDSVPAMIWYKDLENRILRVNKAGAESVGMTVEEIEGKSAEELFPDGAAKYYEDDLEVIRTGKPKLGIIERLETASGEKLWVRTDKVLLRDGQGEITGLIAFVTDITELRRAEEERQKFEAQAQHAQKLESLGVMAGGIAHDFNNLLMTILGNADLALMDMAPEAPGRESVGEIGQAARRAAELTNQMLAYSGHGTLKFRPIDLSKLIVEMAHLLEVSHSKKAILNYEFAQNLPAIKADASQLRQVVMSLITNASEAIDGEDGFIRVSTRVVDASREYLASTYVDDDLSPGPYVCLEVQDTGCGMDEEMIGKVFDPFFTTKFMGRGLGLAAVLGIVRGHHGALIIDSTPGRGTTFRVLFPAHLDAPAPSVPEETVEAKDWRKSGVVLLVDDEETILALVERMLQRAGFTVLTAADGLDAVALFKKHSAEIICVLLDLTMPRMGGDEALDELRRIRHDVPVILSSGYNEEDLIERFEGRGLAGVIQKPYRYEDLMDKMKQALDT